MKMQRETQRYEIEVNGRDYRVVRDRSRYNNWKWEWTVHGGTMMHSRYCDPDKPTYKRVVAAAEKFIAENDVDEARR
jgi:hypothetical protein